jgi:adsorption protein B
LAVWILLSGLDDLLITLAYFAMRRKRFPWPEESELAAAPERRIAVFVAAWREQKVIGRMLERNLAAIRYANYDVFVGVYPNDQPTVRAVAEQERRSGRVHLAMLPHGGPTSKGDCLNWIYRRMVAYEAENGIRFDTIVTHDAEDLVHPEALRLINWFARNYQMVQIPVLALPTPGREWTHGLYCDEFAEYQQKDIPVRQHLGGFLPSNGVGCGFDRYALERLGKTRGGRIFDPRCLTEDYEMGLRLHQMGYAQIFVPVRLDSSGCPLATREYFPRGARRAIRQRSRWVAGIVLQSWQFHGWRTSWRQRYWLWRDRKGLVSNLLSPAANLGFLAGLAGMPISPAAHWLRALFGATLAISLLQAAFRTRASARIYGWRFAALAPARTVWGNLLNFLATVSALHMFIEARLRGGAVAWRKTEHCYPAQTIRAHARPRLGEVLIQMRCVEAGDVDAALYDSRSGARLGERLIGLRKISEDDLYRALSAQAGVPLGAPEETEVSRLAARVMPVALARRWNVLPYRVEAGQLHVATTEAPSDEMVRELAAVTALDLRFRLVRPRDLAQLAAMTGAGIRV